MSTTEDRIESLENQLRVQQDQVRIQQTQVRRQRRWNIALGAVVVVGGLMAATGVRSVPDVIQAKKFEVVNDEGKVIVLMESVFSKGEHYGFVTTQNSKGKTLVELGVTVDGEGLVKTQNGKGQTLVALGATTEGEGAVFTENGKGQTLVQLGVTVDGEGLVKTQNGKGGTLVTLSANTDGNGLVVTENGKGQVIFTGGVTSERSTRSQETAREDGSAGGKKSNDQSRVGNDATYKMEAVQIIREYAANEIRADNRYKGKVVEVRGVVKGISKDLLGGIFILVDQETGADYLPRSVQCYFPESENRSIADLYVGQRVAVKGRVTGLLLNVRMESCRLVSTK